MSDDFNQYFGASWEQFNRLKRADRYRVTFPSYRGVAGIMVLEAHDEREAQADALAFQRAFSLWADCIDLKRTVTVEKITERK